MKDESYSVPQRRVYFWRQLGVNDAWHQRTATSMRSEDLGSFEMLFGATGLQIKTKAGELFEWQWFPKTANSASKFVRVDPTGKHWWDS